MGKFGFFLLILGGAGLVFSYFVENTSIPLSETALIAISSILVIIGVILWAKPRRYPPRY